MRIVELFGRAIVKYDIPEEFIDDTEVLATFGQDKPSFIVPDGTLIGLLDGALVCINNEVFSIGKDDTCVTANAKLLKHTLVFDRTYLRRRLEEPMMVQLKSHTKIILASTTLLTKRSGSEYLRVRLKHLVHATVYTPVPEILNDVTESADDTVYTSTSEILNDVTESADNIEDTPARQLIKLVVSPRILLEHTLNVPMSSDEQLVRFLIIVRHINPDNVATAVANPAIFQLLDSYGLQWTKIPNICDILAASGNLTYLKRAHENHCILSKGAFMAAARNGHLDCLQYLHENSSTVYMETMSIAASNGHLDCLRYLHGIGCPVPIDTCIDAARSGHVDCLNYAYGKGSSLTFGLIHALGEAASNGHIACLEWAISNNIKIPPNACAFAASNGHLSCLKFLHENGCTMGEMTTRLAALNGHFDCLVYAHQNGCVINGLLCEFSDHPKCLAYTKKHGTVSPAEGLYSSF